MFCSVDPTSWPPMPEQEAKRVRFAIEFLRTGSDAAAAKFSGLSERHTRTRLADRLAKSGSFSEAPHPRESPKFTELVMVAAKSFMLGADEVRYTCSDVVAHLLALDLLEPPVNHTNFLKHFKEYLAEHGETLVVGSRKMVFQITPAAAKQRMTLTQQRLQELGSQYQLTDIIFEDETIFEEGPHPKGRLGSCWRGAQKNSFDHCRLDGTAGQPQHGSMHACLHPTHSHALISSIANPCS